MSGEDSPGDDGDADAGLSEDDYERIRAFARMDPGDRSPADLCPDEPQARANGEGEESTSSRDTSRVQPSTCRNMRNRMREAETVREVMENYPQTHTSEVMRHVYGECKHDHEIPATASPQIAVPECRRFREYYTDGYEVSEIADEFYRSDNTVTRHIFGRCSHEPRPRSLSVSEVEAWECDRLRRTYRANDKVTVEGAATAMRLRPEVAATHLFGYCECEGDAHATTRVEEWE